MANINKSRLEFQANCFRAILQCGENGDEPTMANIVNKVSSITAPRQDIEPLVDFVLDTAVGLELLKKSEKNGYRLHIPFEELQLSRATLKINTLVRKIRAHQRKKYLGRTRQIKCTKQTSTQELNTNESYGNDVEMKVMEAKETQFEDDIECPAGTSMDTSE